MPQFLHLAADVKHVVVALCTSTLSPESPGVRVVASDASSCCASVGSRELEQAILVVAGSSGYSELGSSCRVVGRAAEKGAAAEDRH
jgi:hypothetical protein